MTTPRSQLIREKYAILDKYNQLQMRQNIAGTAMDFLSKYIAEEENKRRDAANLQHQTYLENEATKRTGFEEKQYGVAVEEQKENRAFRQSQADKPSANAEKIQIAEKTWGTNWRSNPQALAYVGAEPQEEQLYPIQTLDSGDNPVTKYIPRSQAINKEYPRFVNPENETDKDKQRPLIVLKLRERLAKYNTLKTEKEKEKFWSDKFSMLTDENGNSFESIEDVNAYIKVFGRGLKQQGSLQNATPEQNWKHRKTQ